MVALRTQDAGSAYRTCVLRTPLVWTRPVSRTRLPPRTSLSRPRPLLHLLANFTLISSPKYYRKYHPYRHCNKVSFLLPRPPLGLEPSCVLLVANAHLLWFPPCHRYVLYAAYPRNPLIRKQYSRPRLHFQLQLSHLIVSRYHRRVMIKDATTGISNRWSLFLSARMAVQV